MNLHEFFMQRWEAEQPAFRKVLAAMPTNNLDYKPHERSTAAGNLGWQIAEEQRVLSDLLDTGVINFEMRERPKSTDEIVAAWDKATDALRTRLQKFDESKSTNPAKFIVGGHEAWTDTVGNMLWGFLVDMIHHRGQLSAYLRPMGGKVPAIYGPSADEQE